MKCGICVLQVMKKSIVLFGLIFFVFGSIFSKNESVGYNPEWNLRLSFASQESHVESQIVNGIKCEVSNAEPHLAIDFDCRFDNMSFGPYLGYTRYLDSPFIFAGGHSMNYGVNMRYHLSNLPKWFDVYLLGKIGGLHLFTERMYVELFKQYNIKLLFCENNKFEVGAGLGMGFYFTKHFGMFGEFAAGQFYTSHYNWRVGFLFRI